MEKEIQDSPIPEAGKLRSFPLSPLSPWHQPVWDQIFHQEPIMRSIFRPHVIALLLAIAVLSPHAHAALVAEDLAAVGDGLITLDTASGLQWLDLGLTVPLRINAPTSYLADGWSVASLEQVQALIHNQFGSSITNGTRVAVNEGDAQTFVSMFGPTFGPEIAWGRFQSTVPGRAGQAIVRYDTGLVSYLISDDAFGESEPHSFSGILYVRPVPEPNSMILITTGLGLLGLAARRNGRKVTGQ